MRSAVLALVSVVVACSSDPAVPVDAGAEVATIGCVSDPRAQAYAAGLTRIGKLGKLAVELTSASPAPPLRGTNAWVVRVRDAKGNPVPGATLAIKLLMPDHGHGGTALPAIAPQPDGAIQVSALNFFMPGLWEVTFDVSAGTDADSVVFTFCVAG